MTGIDLIRDTLHGVTAAWRQRRFDDLLHFYRPDVVFVHPGFGGRVQGREACVESYREFLATAVVHAYVEDAPAIDVFGDTAVAVTRFEIDYEVQGTRNRETGHDVLVLSRDEDAWRITWRTLVPGPPVS